MVHAVGHAVLPYCDGTPTHGTIRTCATICHAFLLLTPPPASQDFMFLGESSFVYGVHAHIHTHARKSHTDTQAHAYTNTPTQIRMHADACIHRHKRAPTRDTHSRAHTHTNTCLCHTHVSHTHTCLCHTHICAGMPCPLAGTIRPIKPGPPPSHLQIMTKETPRPRGCGMWYSALNFVSPARRRVFLVCGLASYSSLSNPGVGLRPIDRT